MNNKSVLEKYAQILVDYSTKVQKGDLVLIRAQSVQCSPLVKEIYKQVLKKGANPVVRCSIDGLAEDFIKYANDEQLAFVDPMSKLEYEKVDKYISIGAPYNVKNMARADAKKMAKRSAATRSLSTLMLNRAAEGKLNWVIADYPTNALAQEAKMSLDDYTDFIISACYLDLDNPIEKWQQIGTEQDRLVNLMNGGKKLHILGEKTDITFSVEGRKWVSCAGLNNFPDGEIFTSPVENSATGEIYFDFPAIYRGNESHKIHLNGDRALEDKELVACDSNFHSTKETQEFLQKYHLRVRKYGSSLKVCALAKGEADLYPRFNGTSEWDMAACDIVLQEAGGEILDCITKKPLLYNKENIRNNHFIAFAKSQVGGEIYRDFLQD